MQLFHGLLENNQLERWVPLLDWLLSTDRFSKGKGWGKKHKKIFTTQVKALFGPSGWKIQTSQSAIWELDRKNNPQVVMNSGDSEGESFVRHIRNGISHGTTTVKEYSDKLYFEVEDYHDDSHKRQTAHIWIPLELMFDIYHIYMAIEIHIQPQKHV